MRRALVEVALVAGLLAFAATARAATDCVFDAVGQRLALRADCQTDASILVPDGVTLDGRGHRITAVDPPGGHFLGAVVRNAGASAHVRNLVLQASALASVCDSAGPPDQRLAGIALEDASGSVIGSRVVGINQDASGCQEGTAIAVRTGEQAAPQQVRIAGNWVEGYQKTGILVNGNVDAVVERNRVVGLGPIDFIGQNGVQLGLGARGVLRGNRISQNLYTQSDAAAAGVLLLNAGDGVEVTGNLIEDCDVGVRLVSTSEAQIENNRVAGSTYDAIAIEGLSEAATGSIVAANTLSDNATGIGLYGAGAQLNTVEDNALWDQTQAAILVTALATDNTLAGNLVDRSTGYGLWITADANTLRDNRVRRTTGTGISVSGTDNTIESNRVEGSSDLDIANSGENSYADNRCATSSGPPVDCP